MYQVGINKGIILRCTAYQISRLIHKFCIKLVIIKKLYYDARTTKYKDLQCQTSKTDIPVQEDQNKIAQEQCGHLVQQNMQD